MAKTKVGIINVTGYSGIELARLLKNHPDITISFITGRSAAGQIMDEVFPHLAGLDMVIDDHAGEAELVFSALPHNEGITEVAQLVEKGIRVIDLSADFRLKDPDAYPTWYGINHPSPQMLSKAVYGLPELYREQIKTASLVANPGCYPTGVLLALAPVVKERLIEAEIIIDSKSGISGAGRTLKLTSHYAEANENTAAYALEGHRHLPEIVQELNLLSGFKAEITFLPHLVPMTRGILTTCYTRLYEARVKTLGEEDILDIYNKFYRNEPFIRVVSTSPHTKHVQGSNYCSILPKLDIGTGRLIILSAIDNLIKGAVGQAIQNMNIMLGLDEKSGLNSDTVYP